MGLITKKEKKQKFPYSITGMENMTVGKTYKKHHDKQVVFEGVLIGFIKVDVGDKWKTAAVFELDDKDRVEFLGDIGVEPYENEKWNNKNHLTENKNIPKKVVNINNWRLKRRAAKHIPFGIREVKTISSN